MDLSNIVTHYINEKGDKVSHKKLQKLLYYIEAWNMVHLGNPLIDEEFEAWVHGPVLPSLYKKLKTFGFNNLELIESDNVPMSDEVGQLIDKNNLSEDQVSVIYSVLDRYGGMSAFELEMLTHNEAPWIEARGGIPPHLPCNAIISKSRMKSYYQSMLS